MAHPYVPRASVYRPSYGNVLPQTPAANQPNYNAEVNRIPVNPRRHTAANITSSQQPQRQDSYLHPLIHRTTRAYDLVINYARDSNGGTRWSYEDIDDIKHVGRYLHRDVRDLKYWKELVADGGDMDEGTARRIWDDEERLKKYCERVLDVIRDTERILVRQGMTRDEGILAGEEMDEGPRESEYGVDDGRNDLGGRTIKEESVDDEMYTDLEDKVEEIDQPVDARWATWASESSARFAW
ncbi:hypothetical protein CUC08_Gglean003694 [Alternaria sp. MG1]|nr:hypothetical protein CUC08_Gglean003694 [Alternaria sp. MG1]